VHISEIVTIDTGMQQAVGCVRMGTWVHILPVALKIRIADRVS
jgi:hypothetical protein